MGNGLVIISYTVPPQPIRYVRQGGTGDGSSWANASGDLQSQINASGVQQVWVAGERYTTNNPSFNNGSFSLRNGVAVYGGFAGGEQTLTARPGVNPVGGQPSSTTLTNTGGVVVSNTGLDNTARLDGVVITGGRGGRGNEFFLGGGGIYNESSSPQLTNCLISGNTASNQGGGGIYNESSSNPVLTNCLISGNTANSYGGGIFNIDSSPQLTNCLISGNTAANGGGGGIYNESSSPSLVNCTLTANRAGAGAALINYSGSQPVLTNTILWDNQERDNTAIDNDPSTGVTANFCLIGAGETDFSGTGNRTATVSPFVSGTNFQLAPCSVAIDAGSDGAYSSVGGPNHRPGGQPPAGASNRPGGLRVSGNTRSTRCHHAATRQRLFGLRRQYRHGYGFGYRYHPRLPVVQR